MVLFTTSTVTGHCNEFEYSMWNMATILSRSHCVNGVPYRTHPSNPMTNSWHRNTYRIIVPLWRVSNRHRCTHITDGQECGALMPVVVSLNKSWNKQSYCWWTMTPWCSCDSIIMSTKNLDNTDDTLMNKNSIRYHMIINWIPTYC